MRVIISVTVLSVLTAKAYADDRRDLLEIRCEPEIGYFRVAPIENWYFDADIPTDFYPVDLGFNAKGEKAKGSDRFTECVLSETLTFSVERMKSFNDPAQQHFYPRLGRFEVRLNDQVLAEGYVGVHKDAIPMLPNVSYFRSSDELRICESIPPTNVRWQTNLQSKFERACETKSTYAALTVQD